MKTFVQCFLASIAILSTNAFASEFITPEQGEAKLDAIFYSSVQKLSVPESEQAKLGSFVLGETFNDDGEGHYKSASGIVCTTVSKDVPSKKILTSIAGRADFVFCPAPLLGETREVSVLLFRNTPDSTSFTAARLGFRLNTPDEATLTAFKEAVFRRWGPNKKVGATGANTSTKDLDKLCDSVSTRTAQGRVERDKCLYSIDSNPFAKMLSGPTPAGTQTYAKNGVHAFLSVKKVNFMMVQSTIYDFHIESTQVNLLESKMGALHKEIAANNEKVLRERKLKEF